MTQTSSRIFDEMARLMNDAAGVASGVRREFDTLFKSQAERIVDSYFSLDHFCDRESCCPLLTLPADIARSNAL